MLQASRITLERPAAAQPVLPTVLVLTPLADGNAWGKGVLDGTRLVLLHVAKVAAHK